MRQPILDGIEYAKDIKQRCKKARRSIKSVCLDAKVSYRTYRSWQQGENNPSFALLKRIYAILGAA